MNYDRLLKVFAVNGGYCHILPNQIALVDVKELPENPELPSRSVPPPRIYFVIAFFGLLFFVAGIYGYFKDFLFQAGIVTVCGAASFLYAYYRIIQSRAPVIDRDSIVKVRFQHGVPGQTASRFFVFFRDEKNQLKKRMIVLTNRPDFGDPRALEALQVMQRHFDVVV